MLAVADMDETLSFYAEVLGFAITLKTESYSIVERNGATIHFMKAANESVMKAVRGHAEIYIEVDDIEPLWTHIQTFKPKYKINGLLDRDYGMKEFHLGDPNDCLVFVGQRTERKQTA
jgi:predicted enzyme related to lactoylglutathione lyase